jgi:hypothetical protein
MERGDDAMDRAVMSFRAATYRLRAQKWREEAMRRPESGSIAELRGWSSYLDCRADEMELALRIERGPYLGS